MFNNNSVAIPVSDDEADELGRLRVRARRKRKKHTGPRVRAEWTRRVKRLLVKYWLFLVLVPAAGLLLFEASRIGRNTSLEDARVSDAESTIMGSDSQVSKKPTLENRSEGNLNRLDPTTRVIGGVRQRKLYISLNPRCELLDLSSNGCHFNSCILRVSLVSKLINKLYGMRCSLHCSL